MKIKLLFLLCFILSSVSLKAAKYDASITTGVFGGVPFWNTENFTEDYAMSPSSKFLRWHNRLTVNSQINNFSIHFSASRSDGFDIRDDVPESNKYQVHLFDSKYHFSETKLFRAYGQYKFKGGYVRTGRLPAFNRWLFGSVDGAAFGYKISDNLKISAFGGVDVKYGKVYDSDNRNTVAYGDISYKHGKFGAKVKYLYSDTTSKAGLDFYGNLVGVRFSGNLGYDITNSSIYDGNLGLFGLIGRKLTLSGNISRYRIITPFDNFKFYSYEKNDYHVPDFLINDNYIDRIQAGISYKLFNGYSLNFKQMFSMRLEQMDYLSYLYLNHKYYYIGLNYLSGDTGYERLGISLGGNYSPVKGVRINAGIASVDYMLADFVDESTQSIASYLRLDWKIVNDLTLRANVNYYHNNDAFSQKLRGGIAFQYKIKSGGK